MVDREQEQARQLADAFGPHGRAGRDLAWIVSVGVLLACAAVLTDAADPVLEWAGGLSGRGLSGITAILILTPLGATLYAARRYRDAARAAAQLDHLATHDPLTDLPNRRFLGQPFDEMLALARRQHRRVGVLFVDLEGVKKINEMYGHEVGDELLTSIADRFRRIAGPEDVVVRYAGDEFVFLCPDLTNASSAERLATKIIQAVEAPFALDGDQIRIAACVGVAITEDRPSRADEVLSDADAAMHQARRQGPGSYALFDRSMREQLTPATAERRLRTAIDNGEFRLYYQPIVSLWTKRLVGVEALLRWHDPVRGVTGAEEFMPALEETGLIVPVGNWILEEVCRQSRAWQDAHPDRPALNIKVNISARQLAQATFVAHLRESLEASRADPDRICLEVNENGLLHDVDAAWATLRDAKVLGVSLALDDFGTGYSSLSFLRRFSLDLLSIDRSFVHGIGKSREDTTIVEHVIGMAKALGIVTVAKGVETEEQMLHLRSLNCDLAQGWYFSEPQPPAMISQLLADTGSRQEWRPPPRTEDSDAAVVRVDRFEPIQAS
ncbi:putative bifunctional diguanylate cyclase/phosphodiesterase [Rhabdothermincola sediminis]|uniref:putative bifunctional diguanylate cyclase/phosphodiesterase n=1 Tax=Rhabdothermincola sediminis TaxID=2751370 RepID=UPI001AA015C6|nr:bifunctional diguanylate cyclase/phosphodiesterase [Rhabdothermincola sediminis]